MPAPTDLATRYGAPAPWRRQVLVVVSAVIVAAFLGWLGWTIWSQSTPAVRSNLVGYDVVDQHTSTAKVDVVLADDAVEPRCRLRAYAEDHVVVGELVFTPTDGRNNPAVRTERLATSVELLGCTAEGQSRPR